MRLFRRRRPPATGGYDGAAVTRALEAAEARVRRGVPPEFAAEVRLITSLVRGLLGRVAAQPLGSEEVYVLTRTATDYLPATLDAYLRLPGDYAMTHRDADGRTPYELACRQLALLEGRLHEVDAAMLRGDTDELAVHGRFLEDTFGGDALSLRSRRRR